MFRVYFRNPNRSPTNPSTKWQILATFVWKADALHYAESKYYKDMPYDVKVMRNNRNIKVYKNGI